MITKQLPPPLVALTGFLFAFPLSATAAKNQEEIPLISRGTVLLEQYTKQLETLRAEVWNEKSGGFGYQGNNGGTLAYTGGGAYAAQLCGMRDTKWVQAAIRHLENSPKIFNRKELGHYYYAHYYAIQAMVQAGDEHYAKWYPQIRDSLISLQKPDGSWSEATEEKPDPYPHNTPMAIIILGTPHRYIPVYQQ